MNKLLWTVILAQLLNPLVLLFMKLLGLGGQGERVVPLPCFLRQSLLLSLKLPCSPEQAGHQAPGIISICFNLGFANVCHQLINMSGILFWESNPNPPSTVHTDHLCSPWSYFFNCEIVQL